MITPSQIYRYITKDQLIDHCKRHGLRVIGFRRPLDGELCIYSLIDGRGQLDRPWTVTYDGGDLHPYRIIVERIPRMRPSEVYLRITKQEMQAFLVRHHWRVVGFDYPDHGNWFIALGVRANSDINMIVRWNGRRSTFSRVLIVEPI